MQFFNFPEFLRLNARWAVWRYELEAGKAKPSKPPRSALNGHLIDTTNPHEGWASFEEAVSTYGDGSWWSGIGFLIEAKLNVTVIDLDYEENRPASIDLLHRRIYETFNSYTEYSPSGAGLHIVTQGHVPSARRFNVEVYSQHRFMSVTGRVLNPAPVVERQWMLEKLVEEIAGHRKERKPLDLSAPQKDEDEAIIQRGYSAVNGEKFASLWEGRWQQSGYQSQSEADFALVNMLCHYTRNVAQVRRIFFKSALGERDKLSLRPALLDSMISAGYDRILPEIDVSILQAELEEKLAKQQQARTVPAAVAKGGQVLAAIPPPPGMLGEVCSWFYQAAPYPVPEVALAGGIAFMSALCGAGWNVNGMGLNQFILLTAPTATGKDILTGGMARLMNACVANPVAFTGTKLGFDWTNDIIGPSVIGSGAGLTKHLKRDFLSTVSVQSEFGLELEKLTHRNANIGMIQLRKMYLDLAVRSGANAVLGKDIWSDTEKNTEVRRGISFTLLGESVPEKIYNQLDETQVSDGFIGRFLLIECQQALETYQNAASQLQPDSQFIERIIRMGMYAAERCRQQMPTVVGYSPEAAQMLEEYRSNCRAKHASDDAPVYAGLWSRCHVKAVKLAALVSVGIDYANPVVTAEAVRWAVDVVNRGTLAIIGRFERGEIGQDDKARIDIMHAIIKRYIEGKSGCTGKYFRKEWHEAKQIAKSQLQQLCGGRPQFRQDAMTFDRCFKYLLDTGAVMVIPKDKYATPFNGILLQITADAV